MFSLFASPPYQSLSKVLCLLALSLSLFTCTDVDLSIAGPKNTNQLQPATNYPNYWSWDGKTPILLLGAGGSEGAFLDPTYPQKLNILKNNGGNFSSVTFHLGLNEGKEDSLLLYLQAADALKIAVEVTISDRRVKTVSQSRALGKQATALIRSISRFGNILYRLDIRDEAAGAIILPEFPATAPLEKKSYRSLQNAQKMGYEHWHQLREIFTTREQEIPYNLPTIKSFQQVAAEGMAAFNRSILAGAAAVRHQQRPQGEGFTGPALTGIRAIRTVENHFNFWELTPAPHIIPTAEPNEAYAMTDGNEGFLIYLPTAGSVFLQLNLKEQVPLRVSVVGYLGSQKSELLNPPYKDGFTLYTDEPRGGWMVIKPEG